MEVTRGDIIAVPIVEDTDEVLVVAFLDCSLIASEKACHCVAVTLAVEHNANFVTLGVDCYPIVGE